jgi:tetratricopeptide (TPR) repeat protein
MSKPPVEDLAERIAAFRKMATDDPENELAHYRLGDLLLKAGQAEEAAASLRRTLELSPQFSKVYQLLGQALLLSGRKAEAIEAWRKGFEVADERGDFMPRDEMVKLLTEVGEPAPVSRRAPAGPLHGLGGPAPPGDGFKCQRPTCMAGSRARRLSAPPFNDEVGKRIAESVCADCWADWVKNYSVKVINELRLDLRTDHGEAEYNRYMREFLGIE